MRIVIAGGGVIGLLTAIRCVTAGHQVVLLDQASIPNSSATSFDRHRALRALHLDDLRTTEAAVQAHRRWIELERLLAIRCYERVGALSVLPPEDLPRAYAMLADAGSEPRMVGPDQLATDYPHVRFPVGAGAVFESLAGVLLADRVLTACADWLREHDQVTFRPHSRIVGVNLDGRGVRLADGELVLGDAVLLATGPWSRTLLPAELADRLVLHRQSMIYLQVPAQKAAAWSVTPSILSIGPDGGAWLIPPVSGTALKFSAASACRVAEEVEDNRTPPVWRDHLIDVAAATIPGCDAAWLTGTRDCYYLAQTSVSDPLLAVLADRVLSYAACAGGSFKFAPLIAESLANRLTGVEPAPTGLRSVDGELVAAPARDVS